MIEKPTYYSSLTGLRAIAAFMVFFHHFNPFLFLGKENILYGITSEMHIGVTLFFVLSGFLIAHNYYNTKIDFKKYMINRFARIYPMYFLITTFTFLVFDVYLNPIDFDGFKVYFANITFLRGFMDSLKFSGIAQGWSLTVEEIFYFLAPIIFLFLKKNRVWFVVFPILFFVLGLVLIKFSNFYSFPFMENLNFMLDFTFFGRSFEFFAGVFLATNMNRFSQLKKGFTWFGIFSIFLSLMLLALLKPNLDASGTDVFLGKIINTIFLPILGFLPLFYGLISEKSILSNVLNSKIFQLLGKSSYVFYLIHMGIFCTLLHKFLPMQMVFFLLILFSILLYLFVEKPLNKWIRSKF